MIGYLSIIATKALHETLTSISDRGKQADFSDRGANIRHYLKSSYIFGWYLGARSGYIEKFYAVRTQYLIDILLEKSMSSTLLRLLFCNAELRVASLGGGPGPSMMGLVLLIQALNAPAKVRGFILDFEQGWKDSVQTANILLQESVPLKPTQSSTFRQEPFVYGCQQYIRRWLPRNAINGIEDSRRVAQQHLESDEVLSVLDKMTLDDRKAYSHRLDFGFFDILRSVDDPCNVDLHKAYKETLLFLFFFILSETWNSLRECHYESLMELFERARLGAVFLFVESTDRVFDDVLGLIERIDEKSVSSVRFRWKRMKVRLTRNVLLVEKIEKRSSILR